MPFAFPHLAWPRRARPAPKLALALVLAALPLAAQSPDAAARSPASPSAARLIFVGDVMLSSHSAAEMKQTGLAPWQQLSSTFHQADWVMGNFEGAVGSPQQCLPGRRLPSGRRDASPCMAFEPDLVPQLRAAGFSAMGVEGNHKGDLGLAGRQATFDALRQADIDAISWDDSPAFASVNGYRVGVVALTNVTPRVGRPIPIPSAALAGKLARARAECALLVVFVHWGDELRTAPTLRQRLQARWLVAHGADLVIGSHPHVVEEPQCVAGRPVFYSLGNHLFDRDKHDDPATRIGLMAVCRLDGVLACTGLRTRVAPGGYFPALDGPDAAADRALARCQPALAAPLAATR